MKFLERVIIYFSCFSFQGIKYQWYQNTQILSLKTGLLVSCGPWPLLTPQPSLAGSRTISWATPVSGSRMEAALGLRVLLDDDLSLTTCPGSKIRLLSHIWDFTGGKQSLVLALLVYLCPRLWLEPSLSPGSALADQAPLRSKFLSLQCGLMDAHSPPWWVLPSSLSAPGITPRALLLGSSLSSLLPIIFGGPPLVWVMPAGFHAPDSHGGLCPASVASMSWGMSHPRLSYSWQFMCPVGLRWSKCWLLWSKCWRVWWLLSLFPSFHSLF